MKVWMGIVVLLLSFTILLVITLSDMAPKINVLPQIFPKDVMNFGQFVETTNMNVGTAALRKADNRELRRRFKELDLTDEMFVRFFIENWHTYIPDLGELSYRYGPQGPVARLSAPSIYRRYQQSHLGFEQQLKESAHNQEATSVDIVKLSRLDNNFTVDFDIYQHMGNTITFGGRKRATIRITHLPGYRKFRRDFVNPYGFVITSYNETALKKQ